MVKNGNSSTIAENNFYFYIITLFHLVTLNVNKHLLFQVQTS